MDTTDCVSDYVFSLLPVGSSHLLDGNPSSWRKPGCVPAVSVPRSDGTLFSLYPCVFQYAWVEKHFGPDFLDQIVLSTDKTVVSADLLIDDRPDITGKWPAAGEERVWSCEPPGQTAHGAGLTSPVLSGPHSITSSVLGLLQPSAEPLPYWGDKVILSIQAQKGCCWESREPGPSSWGNSLGGLG